MRGRWLASGNEAVIDAVIDAGCVGWVGLTEESYENWNTYSALRLLQPEQIAQGRQTDTKTQEKTSDMPLFEYPVTQPIIKKRRTTYIVLLIWFIVIGLATVANVISVGYELVPQTSESYHLNYTLWYENFLPGILSPKSRSCSPALINLGEGGFMKMTSLTLQLCRQTICWHTAFQVTKIVIWTLRSPLSCMQGKHWIAVPLKA